ncbi:MAG: TIGR00303 family protein [Chloroflexota bacterium]
MTLQSLESILKLNLPAQQGHFIQELATRQPVFVLTVAYSATVQLPGVSGAGTTAELRELTAAADAEILAHGMARCLPGGVPSNPTGAPGPSIITRAAFDLLPELTYLCVDAGLKINADVPSLIRLDGAGPSAEVTTGQALGADATRASRLFEASLKLGTTLGQRYGKSHYLILAESVPGGTTTALGLLLALGLDAESRVSSSMPDNAHNLRLEAVETGLKAIGRRKGDFANNPLAGAAALGDSMQPVVAGLALAASAYCPVLLAGGTQMAAVLALAAALHQQPPAGLEKFLSKDNHFSNIGLATTRWVSADPTADLVGLGQEIEQRFGPLASPYFSANLNFGLSRYVPMQLYEEGYVKEGVGAGGAAIAAMLGRQLSATELLPPIERVYERIVLGFIK